MELYKRKLIKQCVKLLADELTRLLMHLLKRDVSSLKTSTITGNRILMKPQKKTRLWIKNRSCQYKNHFSEVPREILLQDPSLSFLKPVGIEQEQFAWLLNRVSPYIQKQNTLMRDALPAHLKLKIVLGYLVVGRSYQYLSNQFQIPKNSISSFLSDVMSAICDALQDFIKIPNTYGEWRDVEKELNKKYNFPNCCGTVSGKCIQIFTKRSPMNSDSLKSNRKTNLLYAIMLTLVDVQNYFMYVDVETTVQNAFEETQLGQALDRNDFNLPSNFVLLANSSFPLKDCIMTPHSNSGALSFQKNTYNDAVSRILRTNDDTFKILYTKFRIFDKTMCVGIEKIPILVKSCCSLHNWLMKTSPSYLQSGHLSSDDQSGRYERHSAGRALENIKTFSSLKSITAIEKQNWYISYFNGDSVLPGNETFSVT